MDQREPRLSVEGKRESRTTDPMEEFSVDGGVPARSQDRGSGVEFVGVRMSSSECPSFRC